MITPKICRDPLYAEVRRDALLVVALACTLSNGASGQAAHPKPRIDPGLAFAMQPDSDKRVVLPRLTQFPDASVIKQVNADLDAEATTLRDEAHRCDEAAQGKSEWEETARVDLLTRDVLSIDLQISYFCGGPHPSEEYRPLTYNLRSGKRFDFAQNAEELFLGDAIPAGELTQLYRKHLGTPEGDCDDSFIDPETQLFLHFTAEGLAIVPEVPHFAAACGPEIVIPYAEVKPLIKAKNPFAALFVLKRSH